MLRHVGPHRRDFPHHHRHGWVREAIYDGLFALLLMPGVTLELVSRRHLGRAVVRWRVVLLAAGLPIAIGYLGASGWLIGLGSVAGLCGALHHQAAAARRRATDNQDYIGAFYTGDAFWGLGRMPLFRAVLITLEIGLWTALGVAVLASNWLLALWLLAGALCIAVKGVLQWNERVYRSRLREAQQYADHTAITPQAAKAFDQPGGFERELPPSVVRLSPQPARAAPDGSTYARSRDGLPEGLRLLIGRSRPSGS